MVDLRSDTFTLPTPAMRDFMIKAEVGDDVFGEDPTTNQLQDMISEMLGKEAALFVASGTQANQVSINAHTQPGQEVVCDYNAHILNYESGAAGMLSGVQLHPLIGDHGHPTAEQIAEVIRPFDDHYPQTRLICLENTHNRAGGTVFPLKEIVKISELARKNNLKMHLDGARLWNAAIATGITLAEYASFFDSVSLCFSKGLGAPVGSIVVGSRDFIKRAHFYRKAYGGGMRQTGILAAACIFSVENHFERLNEDHQHARMLAEVFDELPGFSVDLKSVETNIVIVDVSGSGKDAYAITELLKDNGILVLPFSAKRIRLVTYLNLSLSDIQTAIAVIKKLFR